MYEHWNPPGMLAPVGCPLVILLGDTLECYEPTPYWAECERVDHVADKADKFKYRLADGTVIVGRFMWTYP